MAVPDRPREHRVSIVVDDRQIDGWLNYDIESSMIEPADSFTLRRPFDRDAWKLCPRGGKVKVLIDGVVIVDGFIDKRSRSAMAGTLEISGRDKGGRLVGESIPRVVYAGLKMTQVLAKLVDPWFETVTLSDARNRIIRRGKGHRSPAATEPLVIDSRIAGGRFDPGQLRWAVIEEIVSQAGLLAWSSADGRELIVGKPNYDQAPQYLIRVAASGSPNESTCLDLVYDEDDTNRYSLITVVGSGGGTITDYGVNVTGRTGTVVDGPGPRGTGRDFARQKILVMAETALRDNAEAKRIARREQIRRDFERTKATATMAYHGQIVAGTTRTLFAPNTIARVIDEDLPIGDGSAASRATGHLDYPFLVYACKYSGSRDGGETTTLDMVPKGTEITL